MLFDPNCFIRFIEDQQGDIVEYMDNWTDGKNPIYHLFEDLPIPMGECIHIEVAKIYLNKVKSSNLIKSLPDLYCPCKT